MKELPEGYVDPKYVAPFLPDTQALMKDNENRAGKKVKKAAATALFLAMAACGNNDPKPPEYEHGFTGNATYDQGGTVNGTVKAVRLSDNAQFTGPQGNRLDLGKTTNQSEPYNFYFTTSDGLTREMLNQPITENTLNFRMLQTTNFGLNELLTNVFPDGKNKSWKPKKIKFIFNPDRWVLDGITYGTGKRLTQEYISEVERAGRFIQENSNGYIPASAVTSDYNGNHSIDTTVPPEGEMWVFYYTDFNGVGNISYPINGDYVSSGKIFINMNNVPPESGYWETFDPFVQGEQDFGGYGKYLANWFKFFLNRPRDDFGYSIATARESQTGFDNVSSTTQTNDQVFYVAAVEESGNPTSSLLNPFNDMDMRQKLIYPAPKQQKGREKDMEKREK